MSTTSQETNVLIIVGIILALSWRTTKSNKAHKNNRSNLRTWRQNDPKSDAPGPPKRYKNPSKFVTKSSMSRFRRHWGVPPFRTTFCDQIDLNKSKTNTTNKQKINTIALIWESGAKMTEKKWRSGPPKKIPKPINICYKIVYEPF